MNLFLLVRQQATAEKSIWYTKKIREKLRTSIIAEWGYEDEIKLSE